ncbi:hypothetical protein N7448_007284 [Penicillium atrosanguineum]|uniref:NADP-dependent oxidoreductase domain-containing protein n=1 Tax=Penicillium atrosanguineum TaxID=1132637 RepID=A0A9W9GNZ7_9EURO|nr:Endoribonuclease ysh1 [Penicillium atrosanguineum]KAJ5126505.1 hypothetical protein N7448_007284 [Penicillium atrosanguineum]KAJ5146709.1 hypothetical protein N7526_000061 [Penicillium atrosanguineum]KAJ5314802.1 Endoribonuclease ysh1 [Penicillium atrosanguineum]KAJ5331973.1 hypothetical protein N7476_001756 [Penicillium atrosanguineum]
MMADTTIANLSVDGLRAVLRGMLANKPDCTGTFEEQARNFIHETAPRFSKTTIKKAANGPFQPKSSFEETRKRVCCMVGCGLCYEALPLLQYVVERVSEMDLQDYTCLDQEVAAVDGAIVQNITAVQKTLFVVTGTRELSAEERLPLNALLQSLLTCKLSWERFEQSFPLERGLEATTDLLEPSVASQLPTNPSALSCEDLSAIPETFHLSGIALPRVFTGLWQLSSPAWGAASRSKMMEHFSRYVKNGFTAFDMADHYGDAEIVFGRYRASSAFSNQMFTATKYCVFHPMTVTPEAVRANVSERCQRLRTDKIDLLQFHWQFYDDTQYIDALRYIQEDARVKHLGLCNFDTKNMQRVVNSGVKIFTNQVQFSLIDSRPTVKMAKFCEEHEIKLLTYGTLCGGLLAEKWIDQDAPDLYSENITPSQRKYFSMINSWGGWGLFQELLHTLQSIARKHGVTVSNVATRWVLDFPCVGAVIVGARMGVSEQWQNNLASLGWSLDAVDHNLIQDILNKSKKDEMFEALGDCGGEYR